MLFNKMKNKNNIKNATTTQHTRNIRILKKHTHTNKELQKHKKQTRLKEMHTQH